jgi:SpoVK/Ycf46/Vps4 family AAA+-type ATPase
VDVLATRYRLSPAQIASAAEATRAEVAWRTVAEPDATVVGDVFAAARAQTGDELGVLGRRIATIHGWDDLVLPPGALVALRELCDRIVHRDRVLGDWAFAGRLALGRGVAALFTGASGTGKTMAAGVLAATLELDAYRIDLAGIVSPYIGETEKNLDRVFAAAESTDAILFFDEADALFGKRSEVRDARDRYANLEVSYLLQRMEEFDGISILATNFQRNIDEAFLRRLDFTIHFPFPGVEERRRIWAGIWPAAVPLGSDVDLAELAERFPLSGGSIRSAALAAAYLAAADGGVVGEDQVLRAVRRELQKIGRMVTDAELATGVVS